MLSVDPQAYRVLSLAERIDAQSMPEPNSGCRLWYGTINKYGYAQIHVHCKKKLAHRVAYEMANGPVPLGMQLDHICRTRACVNPNHLQPVTIGENIRRGLRGALTTHCPQGHPYSGSNLYLWHGHRGCKKCRNSRHGKRRPSRGDF